MLHKIAGQDARPAPIKTLAKRWDGYHTAPVFCRDSGLHGTAPRQLCGDLIAPHLKTLSITIGEVAH